MKPDRDVSEPLVFNPLKHFLPYIREFIQNFSSDSGEKDVRSLIRELKHLGTSVMDVYTGGLTLAEISEEITGVLKTGGISSGKACLKWLGNNPDNFRIITISDNSQWTIKYYENERRFVHIFPARSSPHTFRVKSNTIKSAILYLTLIGKDYVTEDDLNRARALTGLSPVKEVADTEAVTEMIEMLRR